MFGILGIVMMYGYFWVYVLEKFDLYRNDFVYFDFLNGEGGTRGGFWGFFFDFLGIEFRVGVDGWVVFIEGIGNNGIKWFGV